MFKVLPTWTWLNPYDYILASGSYDSGWNLDGQFNSAFTNEPDVACGDFDGDGCDEIACAFSFKTYDLENDFWLLDYDISGGTFIQLFSFPIFQQKGDVDLTFGDFDGDELDEIAYVACPWDGSVLNEQIAIIDNDFSFEKFTAIPATSEGWVFRCPIAAGDIDGDGRDEIGVIRSFEANFGELFIFEYSPGLGGYTLKDYLETGYFDWTLAMGDVDCDGMQEMVCSGRFMATVVDYHPTNSTYNQTLIVTDGGLVACGEFDGDGMRLRYTGEYQTNTAPPGIIAVVAAPPVYASIAQNAVSSYTAFGQETSIGIGKTSELGTVVNTLYSFEQSVDIDFIELFRFSWSRSLTKEFTRTSTITKTLIKTLSFATGSDDDAVIFHLTDYISYKYEIIKNPYDPSMIGQNFTIDVPMTPSIIPWSLEYFNSMYNQTIGPDVISHVPGQPWTYLNRSEAGTRYPIRWSSGEQIVGQGSGFTSVTIEVASESVEGMTSTITSENGIGGGTLGFGYDKSSGLFESNAYEIIVGDAAIYEGVVGYIANNQTWETYNYIYNMLVYNVHDARGFNYQVINYYVEGAVPLEFSGEIQDFIFTNWPWLVSGGIGVTFALSTGILLAKRRKEN